MYLVLETGVRTEGLCKFALKPAAGKGSASRDGSCSSLHSPRHTNSHGTEEGQVSPWLLCSSSVAAPAFASSKESRKEPKLFSLKHSLCLEQLFV